MTILEETAAPVQSPGQVFRRLLPVFGLLALIAAVAVWAWLGTHPQLGPGSAWMRPGGAIRIANDGVEDTRFVMDGNTTAAQELQFTLRNDGSVPFTVLGLPDDGNFRVWTGVALDEMRLDEGHHWDAAAAREVTLAPGDEAVIVARVRISPCPPYSAGSRIEDDSVPLRIRQLGLTTTQKLPLPLPLAIVFTSSHGQANGSCDDASGAGGQ